MGIAKPPEQRPPLKPLPALGAVAGQSLKTVFVILSLVCDTFVIRENCLLFEITLTKFIHTNNFLLMRQRGESSVL